VLVGDCVSEGTPLANETELLAWAVLRAANRTQARGTTIRLVVPRAPEVAYDLDSEIAEERLLDVEEWLVERGYLVPADIGLVWGTYTITPAGLDWLREGMPEPLEAPQKARHIEVREERLELLRRTEELQSRLVAGTEGRLGDLEEYQRALERLYKSAPGHTLTEDAGLRAARGAELVAEDVRGVRLP
jgi:DNA-binding PadR family transcriptional regulator